MITHLPRHTVMPPTLKAAEQVAGCRDALPHDSRYRKPGYLYVVLYDTNLGAADFAPETMECEIMELLGGNACLFAHDDINFVVDPTGFHVLVYIGLSFRTARHADVLIKACHDGDLDIDITSLSGEITH
ncbi:hypothetical protein O9K51_09626 [Purpureocillium lavendulum]|uniref:Uncharacterized protein n=1 Tax=Purpureocillium lavendulum TaxID=1247861 RepID=A0AB34FF10_9HYPO|nr:hypothetical protein O9K51_09626 [Purpureocillium lavendulum]